MVWTYVCKEEMWESVQEDALFLLWNILSLLISKQELCLFLLLWLPVFNPLEKMQKCEQGMEETREKRPPVLSPCALVRQSCKEGGCSGSHGKYIYGGVHIAAYSTAMISPVLYVTSGVSHKHENSTLKRVHANHTKMLEHQCTYVPA